MERFAVLVVYIELALFVLLLMYFAYAYSTDRLTVKRISEGDGEIIRFTLTKKPQTDENVLTEEKTI